MEHDSAISRNVLILIVAAVAIIVIAAAIFLFLSQAGGDKTPKINATVETSGLTVYVYHDGGDPFPQDRLAVRINGIDLPSSQVTLLHAQEWPWTAGKTMRIDYNGPGVPGTLELDYRKGSQLVPVLAESLAVPTTLIPVETMTPLPATMTPAAATIVTTGPAVTAGTVPAVTTPPATAGETPPQVDFSGSPREGQTPLSVQFTDRSTGSPATWFWNFGDGTTATEQNPVHVYSRPGVYPVSLVVTNSFGSQEKTVPAYVSAGVLPAANFLGSPKNGDAPLTVQFTDLSTGIPSGWNWDFGDGSSSALQNPAHTYISSGTYGVSLTVSNSFGSNSRIATGYITVTPQPRHDLYLTGSRNAYLEPGGYLQCIITRDDAWIKLAGTIIRFRAGDTVQLIVMDPSSGRIDATATAIDAVDFNDVKLFVNSKFVAEGTVSSTGITGYQGLRSQITLISPPEDSDAILYADGGKITRRSGQSVIIRNLVTDSDGNLDFSKIFDEVYFKGGAESYQVV